MRLWLRTDASALIGLGHLMRTIALAEQAQRSAIESHFVVEGDGNSTRVLKKYGFDSRGAGPSGREWMRGIRPGDVVWFDGYDFGEDEHRAARDAGAKVAAIHDLPQGGFDVDLLVVPEDIAGWDPQLPRGAGFLSGPRYSLVRREFRAHRRLRDDPPERLLVTFGGTDSVSAGESVARAAAATHSFSEVALVEGPAAPTVGQADFEVIRDPPSIADTFDQASAVVSAAGSTTWELLCMGLPILLIKVAENQHHLYETVVSRGAARPGGRWPRASGDLARNVQLLAAASTKALSEAALDVVDGEGARRVLEALAAI